MALTDKLTAIADAIRSKTGGTDTMTLEKMAVEIAAIEIDGGGFTIQSGSFTPAENLFAYEIKLTSPVQNFVYQKEAKELSAGVRTNVAFALIEGLYGFGLSTNAAGTALAGVHNAYENGIKISDDGLTITLDRLISGSQFVTEQYTWVAW